MTTRDSPPTIRDFCFGIIKHDALALDGGEQLILERLAGANAIICARKSTILPGEQLDAIYEDILHKPYYESMRASIIGKTAVCLVIGGKTGIAEVVDELKGKADWPGTIRGDLSYINQMTDEQYQAFLRDEYTHHELTGRPINDHIYMDDRFHSSGAGQESRRGIAAVFSQKRNRENRRRISGIR